MSDDAFERILKKVEPFGILSDVQKARIRAVPEEELKRVLSEIDKCEAPKLIMSAIINAVNEHEKKSW